MQPRFDKRVGSGPFSLADQPRFRAGFDFLRLRAQTGEVDEELAHWWETFSTADDDHRQDMVDAQRKAGLPKPGAGKVRRVKKTDADHPAAAAAEQPEVDPRFRSADGEDAPAPRPVPAPAPVRSYGSAFAPAEDDADDNESGAEGEVGEEAAAAPAKKRRRRRRKPSGGGGAGGDAGPAPAGD
jgi:poly(A) polymerase